MTIEAARRLANGMVCFVGIGMPSAAANLARLTHAPEVVLIYESGTIGAKPDVLPLSIGDEELASHADTVVSIPEIFRYWLQGGRIDVGFLGAAQVDRFGNLNSTVIGSDYARPKVRLPGAGGAPEIASNAKETWIIIRQTKRSFVEKVDFMTSVGHLEGGDSRARSGARGKGPTAVITDMGVLTPDPVSRELTLTALHPGITVEQARANTGWDLKVADKLPVTTPPTAIELSTLRYLHERTARAHGTVSSE
ncbi:MAG TPA: CoA-transferase subunit beta [Usitatibacter sp.]|nr:CoA-transferase subunit beta [Usitatibacter sp.]